jgi:hypothetical protein
MAIVVPHTVAGRGRIRVSPADRTLAVSHIALIEHAERALAGGPAVSVLSWPDQAVHLEDLRRLGVPRLVVVGADADPVPPSDDLEDWLRAPADDRDSRVRIERLREQARRRPTRPVLDGAGRIIFGGRWVPLSIVEERLAGPLVARFGDVVPYCELLGAGWPGENPDRRILRPRLSGLRRRVNTLGLELRSIRDVGHLLQPAANSVP